MKNLKVILFSTVLLVCFTNASPIYTELVESTTVLSDVALFSRCYSHITGTRAADDHALLLQVQAGSKDPIAACMEVFDKAMIVQSTNQVADTNDIEGLRVLNVFFDFHKSWFTYNDFSQAPQTYSETTTHHFDSAHESCFLTHALFSGTATDANNTYTNSYRYEKVVNSNGDVKCIRSDPGRLNPTEVRYDNTTAYNALPVWSESSGRGFLIGTKVRSDYDNVWHTLTGRPITTLSYNGGGSSLNLDSNVLHTNGGGLMGSVGFLLKYGQYSNNSDGAAFMRRRATSSIMDHMLCRTAPYRRVEDVTVDVIEYNTAYPTDLTLAFRKDTACMSCHSTQDGMAAVFRNVHYVGQQGYVDWNDNGIFGKPDAEANHNRYKDAADKLSLLRMHAVNLTKETLPLHMVRTDANFHRRPPNGRLVYRSYDGTEVDHLINVTGAVVHPAGEGIQKLGQAMSQGNDLYVCAARRYFQFFTGIEANLQDPGDTRNAAISASDLVYKEQVVQLGLNLKSHQSLRKLVHEIISSDIYKFEALRDVQ